MDTKNPLVVGFIHETNVETVLYFAKKLGLHGAYWKQPVAKGGWGDRVFRLFAVSQNPRQLFEYTEEMLFDLMPGEEIEVEDMVQFGPEKNDEG